MKYTENDYIVKCKELNVEYIGTHKENKKGTVIEYICKVHPDKGIQFCDWSHFKNQRCSCPYCAGKKKTTEDIRTKIKDKNVEIISEYIGCEKPISCKCKKCGNEWITIPKILTTNGSGCPVCGRKRAQTSRRKTHEEFVARMTEINENIEFLEEYKGAHSKIKCRCKLDGAVWYGYPSNLLNESASCPTCNISKSERKMIKILKELKLNILQQYTIHECRYKHPLKFDAFDIQNQIAFEFNGEQHYYPVDFAGKGNKWAKKQLELTSKRDLAKIEYCKKVNIPIIVVPYWERNNMQEYIINELKKIGVKVN